MDSYHEMALALHTPFQWSFGYGPVTSCAQCARQGKTEVETQWPCPDYLAAKAALGKSEQPAAD